MWFESNRLTESRWIAVIDRRRLRESIEWILVGTSIRSLWGMARSSEAKERKSFPLRPIAIVPEPGGKAMWFTEMSTDKVGRLSLVG